MTSVVLRSKNEERWIRRCLNAVFAQVVSELEVVLVDNHSTDSTRAIAQEYPCRVVDISDEEFSFGRALNVGIRETRGELIALLSGHCIPVHDYWLSCMRVGFDTNSVAAVYGRQEPLPDTDPFDKRDLWTTFGVERKVQRKDFFFHNGNSMIRRDLWNRLPFDEAISGVEDRDWAKKVLADGYSIVYEPTASVYHYHGIHHGRDAQRADRVVRVIELIHGGAGAV